MRSIIVFLASVAVAAAAIQQQPSPVYHRSASVVNSSPVPAGKSLPVTSINSNPSSFQGQQAQQPIAEERESGFQAADAGNGGQVGTPVGSVQSAPVTNPQTFKIVYYPNAGQLGGAQGGSYPSAYSPQTDVSFWEKYRMTDVLVGVASAALIVGGGFLLYPKFANVRARALRELADINSEDAARMTKSVFKALERLYEMNNTE